MENRRVIVIVSPGFPADESDSTCLPSQQNLVRAINELSPHTKLIILSLQYPPRNSKYIWFGNEVFSWNGKRKNFILRLRLWLSVFKKLIQLRKHYEMLGILSFWCGEAALIGRWFSKMYGIRHFCWVLGQDARKSNSFVRLIKPPPSQLVAVSTFVQNEFQRNHRIRPELVIENGVATPRTKNLPSVRPIDIIGVGSLTRLKQYDVFIKAIKQIKISHPTVNALIFGKGEEESAIKDLIETNGLNANVRLMGEQPHHIVQENLLRAKILLHPSTYEGYSTACLEALHAGCFVVSFTSPGNIHTDRWQVAGSFDQLIERCNALLSAPDLPYEPVSVNTIKDSAEKFLQLFLTK